MLLFIHIKSINNVYAIYFHISYNLAVLTNADSLQTHDRVQDYNKHNDPLKKDTIRIPQKNLNKDK